jgi:hypothetical protein
MEFMDGELCCVVIAETYRIKYLQQRDHLFSCFWAPLKKKLIFLKSFFKGFVHFKKML